jgi:hypothetical protein
MREAEMKYQVNVLVHRQVEVTIEADSPEQALRLAEEPENWHDDLDGDITYCSVLGLVE